MPRARRPVPRTLADPRVSRVHSRTEERRAGLCVPLGLDAQIRRTPAEGLFDQAFDIPSPGQRHDLKQIGMLFDDAQRVDADGARTAQEDDRAGEAVFPFGRRKFCDIADHAFPGAKKGSPETSPVLAFRRRCVPRRSVFPCPCGQGCNKRESLLQGKVGLRAGGLEEGRENVHGECFPFLSQAFLQCNPF